MPKFAVEYGKDGLPPPLDDGRLDAPAFHRNHDAIWAAMAGFLNGKTGNVLEIGSGTGQHVVTFAQQAPALTWWPSDIAPAHLASIAAWRRAADLANVRAAQAINLMDDGWRWQGDAAGDTLTSILCINVIHISPWRVAQNLMAGAGRLLRDGGYLFTYGPYKRDGQHTAPTNAEFDASLRARNPQWGVRDLADVTALANDNGLTLIKTTEMPANNLVLAFERKQQRNSISNP
jgi:SAM-dependent methyltransferase